MIHLTIASFLFRSSDGKKRNIFLFFQSGKHFVIQHGKYFRLIRRLSGLHLPDQFVADVVNGFAYRDSQCG